MTKIEAIVKVMQDNNGLAKWSIIYNEIEKYYKNIKRSSEWQAGIRGVLYREIKNNRHFKKIDDGLFALLDFDENLLILDEDINDTEMPIFLKIRKGQNKFREKLLQTLKPKCPITDINDERLLIASHIKPWHFSNNIERMDTNNGLILSVLFDKLFDRGLITFSLDKEIKISNSLSSDNIKRIGIENNQIVDKLTIKNKQKYLDYHHHKVFLK